MTRGNQRDLARAKNQAKDAVSNFKLPGSSFLAVINRLILSDFDCKLEVGVIFCLQAAMKGQRQDCAELTPLQRREKY